MSKYLFFAKYPQEVLAGVRRDGYASRVAVLEKLLQSAGGSLETMYFVNSPDWDFVCIVDVSAEAVFAIMSMSRSVGGMENGQVFPLLTPAEADAAVAAQLVWSAPSHS